MVDILIRGSKADPAATEIASAIRDIFGVEPLRTVPDSNPSTHPPAPTPRHRHPQHPHPGTRSLGEVALIILAVPPAIHYSRDVAADWQLQDRWQRFIARVAALRKTSRAAVLIDPGDGKPIPLEEARRQDILAALKAIEKRLKS